MKEIPLTQGKVALVDDEDYAELSKHKWCLQRAGENIYAVHRPRKNWRHIELMHRKILNAPTGMVVDHINRNTLDNRRCNIRICTQSQNMGNQRKQTRKTSSKYKGVTLRKDYYRWAAKIKVYKKTVNIGHYKSEVEAARAYDNKAKEIFGKFALLNFPQTENES